MGAVDARFTVRVRGDDCSGPTILVNYATSGGTAQPGADFDPQAGTAALSLPEHADDSMDVPVPVKFDGLVESVTETTDILLSNPVGARLDAPSNAVLFIIDSDGTTRVALDGAPYSQSESTPGVRIPVFRAGSVAGPSSVAYSITPGATNPGTAGADYAATTPGTISFAPNERVKTIDFSLVNDSIGEPPENLTVSLSGGDVVAPSTTTFTILDNEEGMPPRSKLHHPRHRWRYPHNDYRIREIHVFTKDELGGSGVVEVELALRRRTMSGKCAWWNGKRFRGGDCSEKVWRGMKVYEPGFFYYYRIKALGPSVGTRILNYTAYARSIDGAGNVENLLQQRRNRNTFEIKRKAA